jgi:pimeloyl-ACP methyl ester carboxylesterase
MRRLGRVVFILILVYLGIVAYVAAMQDRFLYQPSRELEATLLNRAQELGLVPVRDGTSEIAAWRLPNDSATRRIIVFHGGSGHALQRTFYTRALGNLGWEVSLFEYPGFGARPGAPGKDSFLTAGRELVETALSAEDQRPLYLLGESMGSGTACALARQYYDRIAGLALVVPYARMEEVARRRMPFLPVGLILRDAYDNVSSLNDYHRPLTIAIAEQDEVVGPDQGRKLYELYRGPKHLMSLGNCKHAEFSTEPTAPWWSELSQSLP